MRRPGWAGAAHPERSTDRVRTELLKHCFAERIEPPTADRLTRMVRSALSRAEQARFTTIEARLNPELRERVLGLVEHSPESGAEEEDAESVLDQVKAMPGNISRSFFPATPAGRRRRGARRRR
ncbi:hypothetical protein [Nocardiopsis xinjiangensis]|uniref:hypothetical protein n=1 Tax=Nocardiopsis xinjiangensis TaxID=124285 RepID=UPI000364225D|nr:hypothetical protein [Nocardiopsis xinjiangensis]